MTTQAEFYGGSEEITISTVSDNYQLAPGSPRVIVVGTITGGGVSGQLRLPDARLLRLGGPVFYVFNTDASKTVEVNDADGNQVGIDVEISEGSLFVLLDNTTLAGEWLQVYFASVPIL